MERIRKRNVPRMFLILMIATYGYYYCDFSEIYNFTNIYFYKFYNKFKDISTFPFRQLGAKKRAEKRAKLFKNTSYTIFELYNYFKKSNNTRSPIDVDLSDLMT